MVNLREGFGVERIPFVNKIKGKIRKKRGEMMIDRWIKLSTSTSATFFPTTEIKNKMTHCLARKKNCGNYASLNIFADSKRKLASIPIFRNRWKNGLTRIAHYYKARYPERWPECEFVELGFRQPKNLLKREK